VVSEGGQLNLGTLENVHEAVGIGGPDEEGPAKGRGEERREEEIREGRRREQKRKSGAEAIGGRYWKKK